MIRAILFDLDETLLDLNLDAYVWAFSSQRVRLVSRIANLSPIAVAIPYWHALTQMLGRREDNLTNAAFLHQRFKAATGVPLDDPIIADCLSYYDDQVFNPTMAASRAIGAHPRRGAHACLDMCQRLGLRVVLATNPTFPQTCTYERMRWAGIEDYPFSHVTVCENSTRAKPWARYYVEACAAVGCRPEECLMVGNDPRNDFASDGLPLRTCYVGHGHPAQALWSGDMVGLTAVLPFLVERG